MATIEIAGWEPTELRDCGSNPAQLDFAASMMAQYFSDDKAAAREWLANAIQGMRCTLEIPTPNPEHAIAENVVVFLHGYGFKASLAAP